jgi:site-specific DNA-methyltransferase (adenine-specific)
MVDKALFTSDTDEWSTPQELFDELDKEFGFKVDVCATHENSKCEVFFSKSTDGLKAQWHDWLICWMNPPYGNPEEPCKPNCKKKKCVKRGYHITEYIPGVKDWVKKAYMESCEGATVVCLLPARTDTKWFHRFIWDKYSQKPQPHAEVRFLEGRLHFGGAENPAPFPSIIVVFRSL